MSEEIRIPLQLIKEVQASDDLDPEYYSGDRVLYRKVGACNYFAMGNGAYQSGCHEVIKKSRPNEAYYCVCGDKIKLVGSER